MPVLSRGAKLYRSILKQAGKKELPYIREQLRVIAPEATERMSSVHVRPTLTNMGELRNVMGLDEMSLHPAALERATDALWLKRDFPTLSHEFGHTTMAGVNVEEMRKLKSGAKMTQYLEDRADEFAMVAAARAGIPTRGTMKMTPEKRQKIFKYLLGASAGGTALSYGDEAEAGTKVNIAKRALSKLESKFGKLNPKLRQQVLEAATATEGTLPYATTRSVLKGVPKPSRKYADILRRSTYYADEPYTGRSYLFGSQAEQMKGRMSPKESDLDIIHSILPVERPPAPGAGKVSYRREHSWIEQGQHDFVIIEPLAKGTLGQDIKRLYDIAKEGMRRYGKDHSWVRLAGIGGATVGGSIMADENEALAVRGVFQKGGKLIKGAVSSAAEALRGVEIQPGRIVKDVIKGKGKWRKILFEDGSYMTVTTEDVNSLCRGAGTKRYIKQFGEREGEDKTMQAIKSLQYHEVRSQKFMTRDMARQHHQDYLKALKEMGEELPPNTVFVVRGSSYFQMPTEYAEHLEQLGLLQIVRGKAEEKVLKPFRPPEKAFRSSPSKLAVRYKGKVYTGAHHEEAYRAIPSEIRPDPNDPELELGDIVNGIFKVHKGR